MVLNSCKQCFFFFTCRCEHICIYASFFLPVCLSVRSTWACIFLQLLWQFNRSVYLFRECLPVPLVYVLGNTIWPQVLLSLFKTFSQRSHPNSEPCFLSFRFTTHYPSRVEETVFREEWERDLERDSERWREGKIWVKANQERQRQRE